MKETKGYRININLHGGWNGKFDLFDKIRRWRLRARASTPREAIDADREINELIEQIKEAIKSMDLTISNKDKEKNELNEKVEKLKEYLRREIASNGAATSRIAKEREKRIKRQIEYTILIHDELKSERDRLYTERKVLKKKIVELERIARMNRDRIVETNDSRYGEGHADVIPYVESEVTSVEQFEPGTSFVEASKISGKFRGDKLDNYNETHACNSAKQKYLCH